MSEYKLVSPLLDGFIMGEPISSHDGISCCPAIKENSEEKYIVKIISVPASQKQLDALLLTGAYPDAASATDYFKEVAEGIAKEASLLKQLARLEGFLEYEDWQIVPMEGSRLGYQIYLISPYKRSLEKYLSRHTMTHLGAINLALDLCAALSVCRRAGFMHMDLKPSNIFTNSKGEFRIGDLGFVKMNALKYTSLPSKYCSSYTPPELQDVLATLNPTADIYAVGMMLYQIYNNGDLPFDNLAPDTTLPAPLNADYELAEIILKACDPNPRNRWQTPIEMGKALVSYMQRNSVGDDPIVPPSAESTFMDAAFEPAAPQDAEQSLQEDPSPAESEELSVLEELVHDETAPDSGDAEVLTETDVTEEVSSILSQTEELLIPQETVELADEAIEAPSAREIAEEADSTEETDEEEIDFAAQFLAAKKIPDAPAAPAVAVAQQESFPSFEEPKKKRSWLKGFFTLVLLALIGFGGFYYYQNYYLLNIEQMVITSEEDFITVELTTDSDTSLLTVVCSDAYGNTVTAPVSEGKALFTGMASGTHYKIVVATKGFHQVSGTHTGTVTTVEQTKILDFTGITGTEDGSVILNFAVEGPEQDWILEYAAEDEEAKTVTFTGHAVTVNNLTVGKTYTFSLTTDPGSELYVVGANSLEFTASKNVIAQDLEIVSCEDGQLNVAWRAPEDAVVENWTVRCYSENGYDEIQTVSDPAAEFTGISFDAPYTIEVTAAGMTQSARTYVSTNPVTISDIVADDSKDGTLTVRWSSNDTIPEGGWLLMYTLDSSDSALVLRCAENSATIEQTIPGADYHLSIHAANGVSVFGGTYTYEGKDVVPFKAHDLDASKISASLCPTPDKADWSYEDIGDGQYTSSHSIGSKVSMVIYSPDKAAKTNTETNVMFVFRDSNGNVLPELIKTIRTSWRDLWNNGDRYCELDLPIIPDIAGQYTVQIFFDRCLVVEKTLNVID